MGKLLKRNIAISTPSIGQEEFEAVTGPLSTGWLTSGPKVKEFEDLFAGMHQVKHAVAVSNCTSALHLSLVALGIGPGDEVVVPSFTWVASANVVLHCGAEVVFADIDPLTFNIDPADLRRKITEKTRAIIPVHLFGLCADMDPIKEIAQDIPLIEDGACAAGAAYKGVPAGGLGTMGCFSFHPRKSVTTGEGGMITTNDHSLVEKLIQLRNHGASVSEEQRHYGPRPYILPEFNLVGYNYRMTDLQGAFGVEQLKKLKEFIRFRQEWADFYSAELSKIDWLATPKVPDDYTHGWQSYVTLIKEDSSPVTRNQLMELLQEKGISTRPGTHAVHLLGYYQKNFGFVPEDFPNARKADELSMAIPLHNRMAKDDFHYVVETLKSVN